VHQPIPFARPSIGPAEEAAVLEVLRSGWLTTGERTQRFEKEFAEYVGVGHAIAVCSGTAALHLSLEAIGIEAGDRVITTPYTFTATAEIIRYLGADPLFVDISEQSFNIDPELVAEAIEHAPPAQPARCVIPVHVAGEPCDMDRLTDIGRRYGVFIVEDAAHAFPSRTAMGFAGTIGEIGSYSFYANKTITTGEGGMVVTNNADIADRMRVMRLHGIDRPIWDRHTSNTWEYDVVAPGFKYNMPDTAAAIGLVQLGRADEFLERRESIARRYIEALGDRDYLQCPNESEGHAWHLFILLLHLDRLRIDRNSFIRRLAERGIGSSVHYKPLHQMSYYRDTYGLSPDSYPRATDRFHRVISLPIYPSLAESEVDRVIAAVLSVGDEAAARR